ncbi:minichromosome maintenance protein MCM [Natronosalvus amylolyticus]|uniref:minichromosome maintenance protein MCM n=1 Tax=Natronosalvus amylolyticus TaxID=2961994 RepID=UPI0020C9AC20|nr:minichromosome maintenance protein MCM [Natronosalvus amylolyticus]
MMNTDLVDAFEKFLRNYYHEDMLSFAQKYPREQRSLYIDWLDIYQFDANLADDILGDNGKKVQEHLEVAIAEYDLPIDVSLSDANARLYNLDAGRHRHIGEYRPRDINKLVGVKGQVKLLSKQKVDLKEAAFECLLCGTMHWIGQNNRVGEFQEPHQCKGCERQGPFQLVKEECDFTQFQLARLTRPPEHSKGEGADIDVVIRGDIAGNCLEGNERVIANGTLSIDDSDDEKPPYDYHMTVDRGGFEIEDDGYGEINIEEHKDRILEIGNSDDPVGMLVDSLAPNLLADEELRTIMTAMVLQLMSSDRKSTESGRSYRGDFHILILSDPGMGKSELLDRMKEISPIGRIASGKGLSTAGVTAAAVKEKDFAGDQWVLKAGLLVLANDGIACLDEIDKVNPEAISAMHRALESQEVTVMKAGIDSTLPANCSLLGAGNPKHGRFNQYEPISEQIDLEPSLMSRFDLMFMMSDTPEEDRDQQLAEHVADSWDGVAKEDYRGEKLTDEQNAPVSTDVFRSYVAYARERVKPVFEDESLKQQIVDCYVDIRLEGADEDSPVPVTARKLQAFFRLAEASARARLSDTIEQEDVDRAITLVLKSLNDVGIDPETGEFDADIIEAGTSKTQRERIKDVKDMIGELEDEYDEGAPMDILLERCTDAGIDNGKAAHEIEKLKQKGEVYEPSSGVLQIT